MRHELAFENHRWTDLIRTGKAIEVMTKFGTEMKKLYPWLLPTAFNVTENRLIYPFHYRELNVNKNLVQQCKNAALQLINVFRIFFNNYVQCALVDYPVIKNLRNPVNCCGLIQDNARVVYSYAL